MYQDLKVTAVIAAAGSSTRMGFDKLMHRIGGKEVLWYSVNAFAQCPLVDEIIVVSGENIQQAREVLAGTPKLKQVLRGGAQRAASVAVGVRAAEGDLVAIHDGARPFVTEEVIRRAVAAAAEMGAAAPAVEVKDTIKVTEDGFVAATPDRQKLRAVQTPQVFNRALYMAALEAVGSDDLTDDCGLLEAYGAAVRLVEGDHHNIKITTVDDFPDIPGETEAFMRIGHGYDVHRLTPGRKLVLGGVDIPFEKGLDGHSDADVLLHAVSDALLGAAALGDIGRLFPDTDPAYEGADSLLLLEEVGRVLLEHGYRPANIDATLLCQRPRLRDHIPEMCANIARALDMPKARVSVKATTEEGLGFTGRGEGIAAHCVCTISET